MTDKDINKKLQKMEQQLELITSSLASRNPEHSLPNPDSRSSFFERNESQLAAAGVSDEIDLRELFSIFWQGKWWIIGVTFLFFAASLVYALSLPNIYKSEVLLAPAEENAVGGLAAMACQLGGLASLAGVNLQNGGDDKTNLAIEVLKSREFISKFIKKHNLLVPLMAGKKWNIETGLLELDGDIYNEKNMEWVREVKLPMNPKPSDQEAHRRFNKLLDIEQDKLTKFVRLSIQFYSPELAKQWVEHLVTDLNNDIRMLDVQEAKKSIDYLTLQLEKTALTEMKSVFYQLVEEQTKVVMFASVREGYVFKTIDPPIESELKVKPLRVLILMLGIMMGLVLGGLTLLFKRFLQSNKKTISESQNA